MAVREAEEKIGGIGQGPFATPIRTDHSTQDWKQKS